LHRNYTGHSVLSGVSFLYVKLEKLAPLQFSGKRTRRWHI